MSTRLRGGLRRPAPGRTVGLGWMLVAVVAAGASEAAPIPEGERRELTLLVTAGLSGRLVEEDGATTVAVVAATVRREAAAARAEGREVLALDAGRTLVPYAESRFDGGLTMIRVLEAAGCRVFAPSAIDLSLGRARLDALAAAASFPILRPFVAGPAVASRLAPEVRLELEHGLELVVVDLFDPLFAGDLADFGVGEAEPLRPEGAFDPEGSGALRVAILHSKVHSPRLEQRGLTWDLVEEPRGIDLVINPDFGHDLALRRETDGGPVYLVGLRLRDESPWMVRRLELGLERRGGGWEIDSVASRVVALEDAARGDAELEETVREAFARFREAHGVPLPAGAPTERADLERFVLEAVRESAAAEVVVLSRGALRPVHPRYFAEKPLRREAVLRLLSLDLQIGVVRLTGAELAQLFAESGARRHPDDSPRKDSLVFLGVGDETGEIEVNGRTLHPEDRYRVATSTYLLAGGDGYALLTRADAEVLPKPGERPAAGERLGSSRLAEVREDVVLPRLERAGEPFVDLERRGLWRFGVDELSFYLDGVETRRDEAYALAPDSRANAVDSSSVRARVRLWVDEEFVGWSWQNRLRASFGLLDSEDSERREIDDDLRLESSLVFSKLRFLGGDPFVSLVLDSEIRRNPAVAGALRPRQFEQALSAGLEWSHGSWRRLRLGVVGRHYSNVDLSDRFGVEAEAHYRKSPRGGRPGFEGQLFYDSLRDGSESIDRLDVELRLLVPVWRELELNPAFNYYNYRDSELPGSADYYRLSLGFSYLWSGKYQDLD